MRIGIDNVSLGQSTARDGIGSNRFWLSALVEHLCRLAPQHTFVLFSARWADPLFDRPPSNLELVGVPFVPKQRSVRVLYQQLVYPFVINRARLDLFFATAGVAPLAVSTKILLHVLYLHFFTTPEAYGFIRSRYLRVLVRASLRRAWRVFVASHSTAKDLSRFAGYPLDRIAVIPYGLSDSLWAECAAKRTEPSPGLALTGGRPYVLYVSSTYPYKNHIELVQAFAVAKKRCQLPHVLLLVGAEGGVPYDKLRQEAAAAGVSDEMLIAGRVDSVFPLYRDATCSAMPSKYETFGFPVLESMALGCPVITSNLGTMAELSGDAALLVNPNEVNDIADALVKVLTDDGLREQMTERGRRQASPYHWEEVARQVLSLMEDEHR